MSLKPTSTTFIISDEETYSKGKGKGKAVLLQTWTGTEVSRELRLPDLLTRAQDGGGLSALHIGRI